MLRWGVMKKSLLLVAPLLFASCQHQEIPPRPQQPAQPAQTAQPARQSAHASLPAETAKRGQYLALPGQEAVDVTSSETDAAFDRQVAAYASQNAAPQPADVPALTDAALVGSTEQGSAATQDPSPAQQADIPAPADTAPAPVTVAEEPAATVPEPAPEPASTSGAATMDYTVKITNGTTGRLFVEAQDASGDIYPCGFMAGNKSYSTERKQSAPIQGPITVVVRDPDQPDAPEIRRYRVTPPADYAGKTIGITIVPGGVYQASVDGQVYYTSPSASTEPAPASVPAGE